VTPLPLALHLEGLAPLHDPVLLVALRGWFDAAAVATSALDHIVDDDVAVTVGAIDPDPFYDFTVERPMVELIDEGEDDGDQDEDDGRDGRDGRIFDADDDSVYGDDDGPGPERREIVWPANLVRIVRTGPAAAHDLVVLNGVEPHLGWPTYVRCLLTAVDALGIGLVVTLGAVADATPHTRMPIVVGSTADAHLGRALALSPPAYQGVTGVVGVLHTELEAAGIPSVSLRVGVPHYLASGEHPRAVLSLVRHLAHVIDVPLPVDLAEPIEVWDGHHGAAIAGDERLQAYVAVLEAEYDRQVEASMASGDELARQFEQFLRDRPSPDDA